VTLKQPLFMQNDTTDQSADVARLYTRDIVNERPGVVQANAMQVVQRSAGANNSIDIGTGAIIVPGTSAGSQGYYHVVNDGTVNLVMSTAAHGSLPRIDSIMVRVRDAFYTGVDNDAQFVYVAGTAAASPVAPDLVGLGHVNFWRLANIAVPANDNTITNAEITDVRTSPTITPSQGYATAVGGCIVCTSSTRPSVARSGQLLFETDTKRLVVNEGTPAAISWHPISNSGPWSSFAPTFTSLTIGSGGSTTGQYVKLGRIAITSFGFVLGTSGFSVPGLLEWVPPAAVAIDTSSTAAVSFAWANNTNIRYGGVGIHISGETRIARWASDASNIGWGSAGGGIPFTWGASDQFQGMAIYETGS